MTVKSKPITVLGVLKRMQALLRRGWTQGTYARSKSGRKVKVESPAAVSFCLMGARDRATQTLHATQYSDSVWTLLRKCLPGSADGIVNFNDNPATTKTQVLKVVSCAIKKAEAAQ